MKKIVIILLAAVVTIPATAHAHLSGAHGMGFGAGFLHPFQGWDHLLAMLAVGLWAARQQGAARIGVPCAFLVMLALGGALGAAGVSLPWVEPGIVASVLVLGILIALALRLPFAAGTALVGLFGLLHGHAHGTELSAAGVPLLYAAGFVLASAMLHLTGFLAALQLGSEKIILLRVSGALIVAAGAIMLAFN